MSASPSFSLNKLVFLLGLTLGLFSAAISAKAQAEAVGPEPRPGDTVEWYTVQAGDTLEDITVRFLGTARLVPENLRLNPAIRDPDLLSIGQRLRIITARPPEERHAEVLQVARVVRTQKFPDRSEEDTEVGDLLREKDGIRTAEKSSAELKLDEENRLQIGERSLIFLERIDSSLRGIRRESIEIRQGEAEVQGRQARADRNEIEIIVGSARARPRVDPTGRLQIRSKKAEGGGGARVMVYGGSSSVEAAGSTVQVPRGMGTAVPEEGPPAAPEKLLPSPRVDQKRLAEVTLDFSNPVLAWQPVAGAASYTVEICKDRACGNLAARGAGINGLSWSPENLPAGRLYWRARAVSSSGLDGYPSRPRSLVINRGVPDLEAPSLAVEVSGPGFWASPGEAVLGAGGRLTLEGNDDVSGVARIVYRWREGSWQTWNDRRVLRPPQDSRQPVPFEAKAIDGRGRESEVWRGLVRVDEEAPTPPRASWSR